jgi:hypothetical protein
LKSWFEEAYATQKAYDERHVFSLVEGGFARTDALSLIGNRVFGPVNPGNVTVASAPVNFPIIWDISWFDWVQYNGSIKKVMVRNIGEALGVGARTNTDPSNPRFLESTVDVANLHRMEDQLGRKEPFGGLRLPRWKDAVKLTGFPPVDEKLATRGKGLYERFCLNCHGPTVAELAANRKASSPKYWTKAGQAPFDQSFLKTPFVDLGRIGTDPSEVTSFEFRFAQVPDPDPAEAPQRASGGATPRRPSRRSPGRRAGSPSRRPRAYASSPRRSASARTRRPGSRPRRGSNGASSARTTRVCWTPRSLSPSPATRPGRSTASGRRRRFCTTAPCPASTRF